MDAPRAAFHGQLSGEVLDRHVVPIHVVDERHQRVGRQRRLQLFFNHLRCFYNITIYQLSGFSRGGGQSMENPVYSRAYVLLSLTYKRLSFGRFYAISQIRKGRPNLRRKDACKRDMTEVGLKEDNTPNRAAWRNEIISYTGDPR